MKNIVKITPILAAVFVVNIFVRPTKAFAEDNVTTFSVSPMNQKISLSPGERYYGTFKVSNPADNKVSFYYEIGISPFTVNNDYQIVYENNGDYNQILDWLTIENKEGVLNPNSTNIIQFYIDVPEDAPAGGQYAAIVVKSVGGSSEENGVNIQAEYSIAHILYAEVAGETVRKGTINSADVSSFLFSGNITGTASITNGGNVHSDGNYKLQVFPLFSDEELYTNEEDPTTNTILPNATRVTSISWDATPSIGIFHVIYNVEFEGVNQKVDKMVIVCPLWLLFVIVAIIFLIIFKILSGKKEKK